MGQNGLYFTPLQAPRSIFSPLSILKLRQEASGGSQWPVRRAGVPGEGAVTTVTACGQHLEAWSAQSGGPGERVGAGTTSAGTP